MEREKEILFAHRNGLNVDKLREADDETYEKFFKKYILPLEIKKTEEKEKEFKTKYAALGKQVPNHFYDPLTNKLEILFDDDDDLDQKSKKVYRVVKA